MASDARPTGEEAPGKGDSSGVAVPDTRAECCDDQPQPCEYHQGWEDGAEAAERNMLAGIEQSATCMALGHMWPIPHGRLARRFDRPETHRCIACGVYRFLFIQREARRDG